MNIGGMFRKNSTSGVSGSSSHPDSHKKPHRERGGLKSNLAKDYKRLVERKVLRTKWVDSVFLSRQGLNNDFYLLVRNTGMKVFAYLNQETYKRATLEFLSTFRDDLTILGRNTTVSF
jgi:hypothetical protein